MQPLPPHPGRAGRLALVAAGLVVLLGIVAFASRSGFGHGHTTTANATYVSYAFTVFLILFVLMIPVTLYAWVARTREGETKRMSPGRRFVKTILFVAVFSVLAYIRHWMHLRFNVFHHHSSGAGGHGHPKPGAKLHHGKVPQETSPHFEWTVLWIAVALGAVGIASLIYLERKLRPPKAVDVDLADDVAATISDAIDDLENEPDARRAVIAAYARMERALSRHGLERRPSETPLEYLRRVLNGLTASAVAVERLTALFERAKFSPHEITGAMKADAIASLHEIRTGMA